MLDILHELGRELSIALYHREDPTHLLLSKQEVLEVSSGILGRGNAPSPMEGLAVVTSHWDGMDVFAQTTRERFGHVLSGFANRLRRQGVDTLGESDVTPHVCDDFIHAPVSGRGSVEPSTATMHLRRSALRAMFSSCRALMFRTDDPTIDLVLPPRVTDDNRPVTTDERDLLRLASVSRGWDVTLRPAAVALTEGGLWPSENAAVRILDLRNLEDQDPLVVRTAGSGYRRDRYVTLTPWGSSVVRRRANRLLDMGADVDARLTYGGDGGSSQAGSSVGMALRGVFVRAGLADEDDLAPKSLVHRAALDVWDAERQNIVDVANLLGVSLDRAAQVVQFEWIDEVDWDDLSEAVGR